MIFFFLHHGVHGVPQSFYFFSSAWKLKRTPWNSVLLCGELKKSVFLNQRQDSRSFQFFVEEEATALRPSRVELYLHLPVGFEVVRREALHIALVEVRDVEYPLAAHLVLDVETEQQLVEADGTVAVVLGDLGDGDCLRAAQDDAGIIRERLLLCGDFFE